MRRILLMLAVGSALLLSTVAPAAAQFGLRNRYGGTYYYPGYVTPRYSYQYNYGPYGYNYSYRYGTPYSYGYGYPSYGYRYPSYGYYYNYPSYGYRYW